MTDIEEKIVFGISPDTDRSAFVILGIPTQAWEFMKDGKTHTFDLTKVGLPIKLILYGAKDHAEAMEKIKGHIGETNFIDSRHEDFSIKDKGKG